MARWDRRYGLSLGAIGDRWLLTSAFDCAVLVDESQRTICCFVHSRQDPAWLDVLVRRVLPRVAMRCGAVALHAAAAAVNGRSLLLIGESGAGKSTTSAALGLAGWDVLSDDISILWERESPQVAPATVGVCVWSDSHGALELPDRHSAPLPGYTGKQRYVPGYETNTSLVPLHALILLDRSSDVVMPQLTRVPPIEAVGRAARQRIRFNPGDQTGPELHQTFAALAAMVEISPCYRLQYPAHYGALPAVVAQLGEILEGSHVVRSATSSAV